MLDGKTVAVVVPAYNEERLIVETLAGIPLFVDRVLVVDDRSTDATAQRARETGDPRVEVIVHGENGGVGAAIVTGYKRARDERMDVTAVMAGDNQMDPADLERLTGLPSLEHLFLWNRSDCLDAAFPYLRLSHTLFALRPGLPLRKLTEIT